MQPFSWEKEYKKTWENSVSSKNVDYEIGSHDNLKKGIIKHLHLILDASEGIENSDFLPTIKFNLSRILKKFYKKFRIQNPLSKLTALCIKDGVVYKYSHLDEDVIDEYLGRGSGDFSISNAMNASLKIMHSEDTQTQMPGAKNEMIKEILVLATAVNTCDSDLNFLSKMADVTVHFISLNGELTLYKKIAEKTNGKFYVPLDQDHLEAIIMDFCKPKRITTQVSMAVLGFPNKDDELSICACHFDLKMGYICPVCHTKVCVLPMKCPICDTQLVYAMNLTQNLYSSSGIPNFLPSDSQCRICEKQGSKKCPDCESTFCRNCYSIISSQNFCCYCD